MEATLDKFLTGQVSFDQEKIVVEVTEKQPPINFGMIDTSSKSNPAMKKEELS